ncbi:hypothetical protein H2199_004768 [Coniosporium tulheliwenetii]|uniref:Uncharacterized protein n=1 Tax=Coniosporium tulheliwenetii TaxID=3383036 RepID=A0ACC2Z597_9PEZI|nr:hypothetical protein H2199_004768 [Cladosporium sp. JES 115]
MSSHNHPPAPSHIFGLPNRAASLNLNTSDPAEALIAALLQRAVNPTMLLRAATDAILRSAFLKACILVIQQRRRNGALCRAVTYGLAPGPREIRNAMADAMDWRRLPRMRPAVPGLEDGGVAARRRVRWIEARSGRVLKAVVRTVCKELGGRWMLMMSWRGG